MESEIWQVVTTCAGAEEADRLAGEAVRKSLAACAQVEGPVQSHYCWEGQARSEPEYRVLFKVSRAKTDQLISWIGSVHPYTVPEILAWPAPKAHPDYRDWVNRT